jgi:DNA-binding HxlR family transcriptional regulator
MRRTAFDTMRCSIARTLDVVGDPWTLLIVREAFFGTTRFDDFRRNLAIPRATLSARLASLVEHGVLDRRSEPDTPGRPRYLITEKGRALGPVMIALMQWGDQWSGIEEPPVTLIDRDTGDPIEPEYIDRGTDRPLRDLRLDRRINSGPPH